MANVAIKFDSILNCCRTFYFFFILLLVIAYVVCLKSFLLFINLIEFNLNVANLNCNCVYIYTINTAMSCMDLP